MANEIKLDVNRRGEEFTKTYKTVKGAKAFVGRAVEENGGLFEIDGNRLFMDGLDIICDGCEIDTLIDEPEKEIETKNPCKGEEKMNDVIEETTAVEVLPMTENFVVGSRDAKLQMGTLRKAKPAVEAVEGVPAVKEKKDDDGNIIQEAKPAVKAVAAKPAQPQEQEVHLDSVSEEVMREVRARMADQGFADKYEGQIIMAGAHFRLTYTAEDAKIIRAAFKNVKAKDRYNAPGLKILADQKKAEEAAKKAEEKAKADAAKKDAPEPKVEPEVVPEPEQGDDEPWPGEDEGFDV